MKYDTSIGMLKQIKFETKKKRMVSSEYSMLAGGISRFPTENSFLHHHRDSSVMSINVCLFKSKN